MLIPTPERGTKAGSFTHLILTLWLPCGQICYPLSWHPIGDRKSWKAGVSPCSFSHLQPINWGEENPVRLTAPRFSYLLKQSSFPFLEKKKKKISIYLCVYPQISNTIRLGTTTVLSVAAASSETRSKKHLVVRMSPLHNSLGLLSLLYFPKWHSGVSFRSLLWQEDILLIAVTSCQACFDTTAQSFSCRCLQCHCWKKHWKSCCMSTRTEELKFASLDPPKAVLANGKRMRNQHWGGRQVFCWSYTLWQWEQYRNTPT